MARRLRHTPERGSLFEITCRTVQSRFLLRPCPLLNEIILGALARAKRRYGVELSAFVFLANHLHILAWTTDSEQLARFMGYFLSKLAREVSRLTGWRDKVFARRYQAIPISAEEAAQVERLLYILSNGCKENLVARPQDWPGVHCVDALLTGEPLKGTWFDRTQEFAARNRGESFGLRKYAFDEILALDPLPCWRHLSPEQYRSRMAGLVEKITVESEVRRRKTGIQPLGPDKIVAQNPFGQPVKTKRSFAPRAHAYSREIRKAMYRAYAGFVAAFREAAEKLRGGDRMVRFPDGSFPPGLPFVRGGLSAAGSAA
jgi:REP element-mobilizing transposase RayT